jgi:hypothetical protein
LDVREYCGAWICEIFRDGAHNDGAVLHTDHNKNSAVSFPNSSTRVLFVSLSKARVCWNFLGRAYSALFAQFIVLRHNILLHRLER